jgi:uncharacterized membrane protein YeaQ/YmgE (transglycosylase-associated protein family)
MAGSLMLINPRKRRKSAKRAKNPVSALKRRRSGGLKRRRNPIARTGGGIITTMQSGAIGAAGAIGAKMVTSFLPIPDTLKAGTMAPLVNALIGAGVGMAVGKFASKSLGNQIGVGAVTVALYDAMRGALAGKLPGLSGDDYMDMDDLAHMTL